MMKRKIILYLSAFAIALGVGAIFSGYSKDQCEFETVILKNPEEDIAELPEDAVIAEESLININKASVNELITLKGIGEKLAERIIDYREANGEFEMIEDLLKVPGIGEKKFEAVKEYITVN